MSNFLFVTNSKTIACGRHCKRRKKKWKKKREKENFLIIIKFNNDLIETKARRLTAYFSLKLYLASYQSSLYTFNIILRIFNFFWSHLLQMFIFGLILTIQLQFGHSKNLQLIPKVREKKTWLKMGEKSKRRKCSDRRRWMKSDCE